MNKQGATHVRCHLLQNHNKMAEHDAALVVMEVLHVLAECNRQKVCYADVKPANILLKRRYPDLQPSRLSNCQVSVHRRMCMLCTSTSCSIALADCQTPPAHSVHAGSQDAPPEVRVIDFGCSQFVLDGTKLEKRTGEWSCPTLRRTCRQLQHQGRQHSRVQSCRHSPACRLCAGTPLFLPPEMFMRHWGPEADLWSLGMVTYVLLSGACCCRSFAP